jgi:hypothetical protein
VTRGKILGVPPRALPLRWGAFRTRHLAGIALLIAGAVNLQSANTYTLVFLLLGSVAHIAGWLVLPVRGSRRVGAILPSFLAVFAMLTGPQALPLLVVPLLAWLWVWQRPAMSYLAVLPLLAVTMVFARVYREQSAMPFAFGVSAAVFVGCAWAAAALGAGAGASIRKSRVPRAADATAETPGAGGIGAGTVR